MIKSPVVLAESYTPPPLTDTLVQTRVVLAEGYSPPDIGATLLPCSGTVEPPPTGADAIGALSAALATPIPSITAAAGGEVAAAPSDALGALSAVLPVTAPQITASATGGALPSTTGTASAYLPVAVPALSAAVGAEHHLDLPDAVGVGANARSQSAQQTRSGTAMVQQSAAPTRLPMAARAAQAMPAAVGTSARAGHMAQIINRASAPHQHGERVRGSTRHRWADTIRARRTAAAARHQHGIPLSAGTQQGWADTGKPKQTIRAIHGTAPAKHALVLVVEYALRGVPVLVPLRQDWTQAIPPPPGRWWPRYEAPLLSATTLRPCNPNYVPRHLSCPVVLGIGRVVQPPCDPTDPPGPVGQIIVPIRRAYIVLNAITLARASDGAPIDATALTIGFDCDSWLPTFSATIPENMRQIVMPGAAPVEVVATVNGTPFHFLVETIQRARRGISERAVTIGGRGVACELGAPYAPTANYAPAQARTAQQLVDDALQFTGYTQTWGLVDWLVPGGVFSLTGTPADVAATVANAAGGVLAAHWSQRNLRMLPRYPVKPWDWPAATPDIVIPSAAVQSEGVEWQEMPDYDVVYVSGTVAGVTGQVKRAGTAGGKPAPMVADQLITHADAARQRGTTILSNTGRKAALQISLPVLPETGVIDLCKLVEFTDGSVARRGIVRANQISVAWPSVRQTLTIEAQA